MNKFLAGNRKLFFGVFVALIAYVLCQTGQLSGELFTDISKFDLGWGMPPSTASGNLNCKRLRNGN